MTKANIGNSQVVIKIGRNTVLKAYRGSSVLYNPAPAAPISVSPLHLANGFLSTLGNDTINESEFPNAVLSNGYLSALHIDFVLPNAPTNLAATAGNAQVSLTWTAPTFNGGSTITDYSLQFSTNSGSTWTTFADGVSNATSATVTGLTNGTAYVFRVAGINANGTGEYTVASSSVTPNAASVPGAPTLVRNGNNYWACQDGDNAAIWNTPSSNGGSTITSYVWRIGSGSLTSVSPSTGTSNAFSDPNWTGGRVTGLPTGGSFQVAAVNAVGTGLFASLTLQGDCN
jgi:hypothetical protein